MRGTIVLAKRTHLILLFALLLTLILGGCYRTGLGLDPREDDDDAAIDDDSVVIIDDDDDTSDDDDFSGDFQIIQLDPDHGSAEGGDEVEIVVDSDISGADPDDIIVRFGGELAEVLFRTEDSIHVTTPPSCSLGNVTLDVDIVGAGEDSDTYEYEAWAYGQDVAVLGMARTEVQSAGTPATAAAIAEFFTPTTAPPLSNLPALGSCVLNPNVTAPPRPNYSVGSAVSVSSGGTPFSLMLDPTTNSYSAASLSNLQTPNSATYGLSGGTDPDGCPVDISGIASAGDAMAVWDPPMTMPACASNGDYWCYFLDPDPSGLNQNGITVGWVPGTDHVVLQMDWIDYYGIGGGLTASLVCHLQDTGGVTLGSNEMSGMPEGLYQFSVLRYRTTTQAHPRSGGTVYGTYMDGQVGYGWVFQAIGSPSLGDGCYSGCQ